MRHLWCVYLFCLFAAGLWAQQTVQVTASPSVVAFVKHMLISIASPDHDPKVCALNEQNLVRLYGFNSQEAAIFHSAGQTYSALI